MLPSIWRGLFSIYMVKAFFEIGMFYLRPFRLEDQTMLFEWIKHSKGALNTWKKNGEPCMIFTKNKIEGLIRSWEIDGVTRFAVFDKVTNAFVGHAGLEKLPYKNNKYDIEIPLQQTDFGITIGGEFELGYGLHYEYWGKGHATTLTSGLLDWVYATKQGLERVIAVTATHNIASTKVLKKAGFKFLRIFPQTEILDVDLNFFVHYKNSHDKSHHIFCLN